MKAKEKKVTVKNGKPYERLKELHVSFSAIACLWIRLEISSLLVDRSTPNTYLQQIFRDMVDC